MVILMDNAGFFQAASGLDHLDLAGLVPVELAPLDPADLGLADLDRLDLAGLDLVDLGRLDQVDSAPVDSDRLDLAASDPPDSLGPHTYNRTGQHLLASHGVLPMDNLARTALISNALADAMQPMVIAQCIHNACFNACNNSV